MSEIGNYKPNSHKSKEEAQEREKRVEKPVVSSGSVKVKKKSEASKLAEAFIAEDAANVKNYILMDVLIPTIKKTVYDIITNTFDMILFGGSGHRRGDSGGRSGSYVSYNRFSDRKDSSRYESSRTRNAYTYDDIIFSNRGEAEEVLSQMDCIIDSYQMVRVADLFDMVGESCPFTYQNFGWTNLRNAEVVRVRDGYKIKLPRALPLD